MKNISDYLSESLNIPTPKDWSMFTVKQIVGLIKQIVNSQKKQGTSYSDFYAGITKDVHSNMIRHGNKEYVVLADCGSREKAGKVESDLENEKFYVGKKADNGGDEKSSIIYVIYMDKNFKQ